MAPSKTKKSTASRKRAPAAPRKPASARQPKAMATLQSKVPWVDRLLILSGGIDIGNALGEIAMAVHAALCAHLLHVAKTADNTALRSKEREYVRCRIAHAPYATNVLVVDLLRGFAKTLVVGPEDIDALAARMLESNTDSLDEKFISRMNTAVEKWILERAFPKSTRSPKKTRI